MPEKPKILGKCKHCFCNIGRENDRLVHIRTMREYCSAQLQGSKKAELRTKS